jgi:hypothetical protein
VSGDATDRFRSEIEEGEGCEVEDGAEGEKREDMVVDQLDE